MINLLGKFFIKDNKDETKVREMYGVLCGTIGIFLNILLFGGKFFAGMLSHSIAITADAFNNLSDAGSSIVTLIGFKIAGTKPDSKHPFGHGRMEYVSGLIVAMVILLMGYELIRDSVVKIIHPQRTEFTPLIGVILVLSIAVKLYMAYYNHSIGKKIKSPAMQAVSADSLSDSAATTVVLFSSLFTHFTGIIIDGYCGVLVGLFVAYAGYEAAGETLNPLLGQAPSHDYVKKIKEIVLAHPEVHGIHDLIVHDYGPGRQMVSLHAEVSSEADILEIHDVIDNIETELHEELGCDATIHIDPLVMSDEHINAMRDDVMALVKEIDSGLSIHDFRMVTGPTHTNLIFDVLAPFGLRFDDEELLKKILEAIEEKFDRHYYVVIKIDHSYV